MSYKEFKDKIIEAIELFPLNHQFNLREIFGTEKWVEMKKKKLNYGSQFYMDFQKDKFPNIDIHTKAEQGEQIYVKIK